MTTKNDAGELPPTSSWSDPDDAPELTEGFFADAEQFKGNTLVKRGRGRPPTGNAREVVSFRLDQDVLTKLREAGPGWHSQVNGLLRKALDLDGLAATGVVGGRSEISDVVDVMNAEIKKAAGIGSALRARQAVAEARVVEEVGIRNPPADRITSVPAKPG